MSQGLEEKKTLKSKFSWYLTKDDMLDFYTIDVMNLYIVGYNYSQTKNGSNELSDVRDLFEGV